MKGAKRMPRWPLLLIAAPAAVAVWSGWVGLGQLCGFGVIHPLPGIWDGARLNTAITLPVGVEAYAAYALGSWLRPGTPERAKGFARRSAIGSLALGVLGQVAYHLLAAAHATRAPWPVVVLVSGLPVVVLGLASGLSHLLREPGDDVPAEVTIPSPEPATETVADTAGVRPVPAPEATQEDTPAGEVSPAPKPATGTVAVRAPRRPVKAHVKRAERVYREHIESGRLPSIRALQRDLGVGQPRAKEVRAHLASLITEGGAVHAA